MTHTCTLCNRKFTREESLTYHINNNVCEKQSKMCKGCKIVFSSQQRLRSHIKAYGCSQTPSIVQSNIDQQIALERLKVAKEQIVLEQMKLSAQKPKPTRKQQVNTGSTTTSTNTAITVNIHQVAHDIIEERKIEANDSNIVERVPDDSIVKLIKTNDYGPSSPEFDEAYNNNQDHETVEMIDAEKIIDDFIFNKQRSSRKVDSMLCSS